MATFILLLIIYLAFVSLGVPDGVMGVAWPEMQRTFAVPFESAGYITAFGTIGSVTSAFLSGHILKRFGTGVVVCFSCALTGASFLGFFLSGHFAFLLLLALPLGLGAGAVDTGLNDYVARNFTSRHMNWLHASWGLGAFVGPMLMTWAIVNTGSWRNGYLGVSIIQLSLSVLFLLSLPLWKLPGKRAKLDAAAPIEEQQQIKIAETAISSNSDDTTIRQTFAQHFLGGFGKIFRMKGLLAGMLLFLFYVGSETAVGLWSASYLRFARDVSVENAGLWVSMFYGSITVGRIIAGIFVNRIGTRKAIWIGVVISIVGFILLMIPVGTDILCPVALSMIGLGFAPIYPCAMQDAPIFFGKESAIAIGYEMGCANIGYAFLPMAVGKIADATTLFVVPIAAFLFLLLCASSYRVLSHVKADS